MPQDPAQIQRQIEDTRAELAHTIDAIADIVSPKRVAKRGMNQIRARVEELRTQISGPQHDGQPQRQLPPLKPVRGESAPRDHSWLAPAVAAAETVRGESAPRDSLWLSASVSVAAAVWIYLRQERLTRRRIFRDDGRLPRLSSAVAPAAHLLGELVVVAGPGLPAEDRVVDGVSVGLAA